MPKMFCPSNKRLKDHCAHCSIAAISVSISLHAPSSSSRRHFIGEESSLLAVVSIDVGKAADFRTFPH